MANLTIVVAMDKDRAIGKNGDIPWSGRLRADMDHFKKTTMGHSVVMGRKTYDSIPKRFKPLEGRENIILTRDLKYFTLGCNIFHHRDEVLLLASYRDEIFIIGGAEIYSLFLPYISRMIVTHVDARIGGDTFFPNVPGEWKPRQLFQQIADEKNQYNFSVTEYTRI